MLMWSMHLVRILMHMLCYHLNQSLSASMPRWPRTCVAAACGRIQWKTREEACKQIKHFARTQNEVQPYVFRSVWACVCVCLWMFWYAVAVWQVYINNVQHYLVGYYLFINLRCIKFALIMTLAKVANTRVHLSAYCSYNKQQSILSACLGVFSRSYAPIYCMRLPTFSYNVAELANII